MKNNIFFTVVFLLFISSMSFAQSATMTKTEFETLRIGVTEKSKKTTTIESDFVQLKHLDFLSKDIESSGKLFFKSPNSIKWEYQKPYKYSATFTDNQLFIDDDGAKNSIDLGANKSFRALNDLIVKSIRGDLFDYNVFEINYYKNLKNYIVVFTPKDVSIKSFITEVEITFDKKTFNVIKVKMIESLEDYTLIEFSNQQYNNPISDAVFAH